ncbi:hypothetical protein GRF29_112g1481867 [Pseudopithomyces chartarum]|uniref:Rhodopsin domain-containing protein n=1 Tax=Pseudopithomyces chartarum TaxID=1892770 RepID=A0AAN6LS88_9PLEO|nr:hypothetical protein GRF29_112g1481867 [Pseudopithomyces chartarum]
MVSNPRGEQSIVIAASFTAITIIVVLLRIYTRLFMVRATGIEDYFTVAATVFSIGLTICIGFQVHYGMGQHIWTVTNSVSMMKSFYTSLILYNLSLSFTKISILLQYRRVFMTRKFSIVCRALLTFVSIYSCWRVFGSAFQCIPISAFWTQDHSKCMSRSVSWYFNAGSNIVTDIAIMILPMPVIKNLSLPRRQKYLLMGVFAMGGFVCIVSILRLQSLVAISNSDDPTWDNPPAATWSAVESNVGIICSSLPCIRPLLARWLPRVFTTGHRSTVNSNLPSHLTFDQSTYKRHTNRDVVLAVMNKSSSRGSVELESPHDGIKAVTQVSIDVADMKEPETGDRGFAKVAAMPPKTARGGRTLAEPNFATSTYQSIMSKENRSVVTAIGLFAIGVTFLHSSWAEILIPA